MHQSCCQTSAQPACAAPLPAAEGVRTISLGSAKNAAVDTVGSATSTATAIVAGQASPLPPLRGRLPCMTAPPRVQLAVGGFAPASLQGVLACMQSGLGTATGEATGTDSEGSGETTTTVRRGRDLSETADVHTWPRGQPAEPCVACRALHAGKAARPAYPNVRSLALSCPCGWTSPSSSPSTPCSTSWAKHAGSWPDSAHSACRRARR